MDLIKRYKVWKHLNHLRKNPAVANDPRSDEEKDKDYRGIGATMPVLQADGQWDDYKPVYETQFLKFWDTFACVTFSSANCLEFLHKRKYGTEINTSDRFIAIMSGTKCNFGNWLQSVGNTWNNCGFLYESEFPSPQTIYSCEEYYIPITQEQKDLAKSRLKTYTINYRWIAANETSIKEALKYAPVQVVINNGSHAVTCYGYEGSKAKIYDHYLNYGDNCYLYDLSKISHAMQYDITIMTPQEIMVDKKYGENIEDYEAMKILPAASWVYIFNKLKRFPTKRELYGLTIGHWDYEAVFLNRVGDKWLYKKK
jgi:hypothetical protein